MADTPTSNILVVGGSSLFFLDRLYLQFWRKSMRCGEKSPVVGTRVQSIPRSGDTAGVGTLSAGGHSSKHLPISRGMTLTPYKLCVQSGNHETYHLQKDALNIYRKWAYIFTHTSYTITFEIHLRGGGRRVGLFLILMNRV